MKDLWQFIEILGHRSVLMSVLCFSSLAYCEEGATVPWVTYEAEEMKTNGQILGPSYSSHEISMESSGLRCVKLSSPASYVEFVALEPANSLVLRYSLPDSTDGGGVDSSIDLYQNSKLVGNIPLTSKYSWLYGKYPFTNDPKDGLPRHFYDEARLNSISIAKGDVLRLQKNKEDSLDCTIDLVDLELVGAPWIQPAASLSVLDFGAKGDGSSDDTPALLKCLKEARAHGKTVWVPPGTYCVTQSLNCESGVTIQGAGMWYTTFVGDASLYHDPKRRVTFVLDGDNIKLSDFSIIGKLDYRSDQEPNDGILSSGCSHCVMSRIWVEHTKTGAWIMNGSDVRIEECRFRDTLADGVNLCDDCRDCVIKNCSARGTGDDCFAIWPFPMKNLPVPADHSIAGSNLITQCTGQLNYLGNGGAIYGGKDNCLEHCRFEDIARGNGILISTTFPTADPERGVDYNFSGTTTIRNTEVRRCGGGDASWLGGKYAGLQFCANRKSISGVKVSDFLIQDSLLDGISFIAPDSEHGPASISGINLENVTVSSWGKSGGNSDALFIDKAVQGELTCSSCQITGIMNKSTGFSIITGSRR